MSKRATSPSRRWNTCSTVLSFSPSVCPWSVLPSRSRMDCRTSNDDRRPQSDENRPLRQGRAADDGADARRHGAGLAYSATPDPADGRTSRIKLTEGAEERLPGTVAVLLRGNQEALRDFADEGAGLLIALLTRLIANLDQLVGVDASPDASTFEGRLIGLSVEGRLWRPAE